MSEQVLVDLRLSCVAPQNVIRSLLSVRDVLMSAGHAAECLIERFPDFLDSDRLSSFPKLRHDFPDALFGEPAWLTTSGAVEIRLKPSDRYLDFVTALAGVLGMSCNVDLHEWPILSVAAPKATVAEAGGASSPASRGPLHG